MEKTIYRESRVMTKDFLDNIFNVEAVKKSVVRQLVHHIIDNMEIEDLEKLGFNIETVDPDSDESFSKMLNPETSSHERAQLEWLRDSQAIEMRVKLLL